MYHKIYDVLHILVCLYVGNISFIRIWIAQISNNKHTYICSKSKNLKNKDFYFYHNFKTTKNDLAIHCLNFENRKIQYYAGLLMPLGNS